MSGRKDNGRGEVPGGGGRQPEGPGASDHEAQAQVWAQMQWDRVWTWWGCPHPVKWQWSPLHLCCKKAPMQRCTRAVPWQPPSNLPGKIPPGRWYLSDWSSVPSTLCASWPVWLTYVCTFTQFLCLLDGLIFQFSLAWLASCRSFREEWQLDPPSVWVLVRWWSDPPSVWVPSSQYGGGTDVETDREIGLERWWSSSELSHRISGSWGYVSSLSSPSLCGSSTSSPGERN